MVWRGPGRLTDQGVNTLSVREEVRLRLRKAWSAPEPQHVRNVLPFATDLASMWSTADILI
jgi:hypothetical protein